MEVRRIALISSASGNGKTTLGRRLGDQLGVPFVELDALVHGPGWRETPDEELRAILAPILATDGWVIDGTYMRKLGNRVLDAADLLIWLDLPIRVWLPRLIRRSWRRLRGAEPLWNGNRESLPGLVWGPESLFGYALHSHFRRRREWPDQLRGYPLVRLRTVREIERFIAELEPSSAGALGTDPRPAV
jgi:adenylate kinase family enzyme